MGIIKAIFGVIGAILLGGIFLATSMFQPIDGVPGYKLITPNDYSIIFGFALVSIIGIFIGYFTGSILGVGIADGIKDWKNRKPKKLIDPKYIFQKTGEDENTLLDEIESIFIEAVFTYTEEYLSKDQPLNNSLITLLATETAASKTASQYHLLPDEIQYLIKKFTKRQKIRPTRACS